MSARRKPRSLLFFVLLPVCGIVVLCIIMIINAGIFRPLPRGGIVLYGDPVQYVWIDRNESQIDRISLPVTTRITGALGYKQYELKSLYILDAIDRHNGRLFMQSIEEALGLPVVGMLGPVVHPDGTIDLSTMPESLNWELLRDVLRGNVVSTLPIVSLIRLMHDAGSIETVEQYSYDITGSNGLLPVAEEPGAVSFDPALFDAALETSFVRRSIMRESFRVGVVNTSSVPFAGKRAERILRHVGFFVTLVSTETGELDQCQVVVSTRITHTESVRVIRDIFRCSLTTGDTGTNDIVVKLGIQYATRLLNVQ